MLDGGLDQMYRDALATSHQAYVLIEVLDGQQNVLAEAAFDPTGDSGGLIFTGGSVTATLTSRISRGCSVVFPEQFYPFEADGLLAPYGNMVRAWRGIEFADGTRSAWVVFVGRIQSADLNEDGTCTIQAADFAADVLENRFVVPENSQAASAVTDEVVRLITDGFPQATFRGVERFDIPARTRTWQLDRGQALDELSTSVGAFWYPLADGPFTLRRYPWTVVSPAVVTYTDTGTGATVSASRATRSRADTYNSLTVTGERLNGDTPVYALAQDDNPESATYVNGNFGRRHQLMRLQTPGSQGAALGAARENLRRIVSLFDTWSWSMSVDAALELGDTVGLAVHGRTDIVQVVAGMRVPLDLSGDMQVSGRSRIAVGIENGV